MTASRGVNNDRPVTASRGVNNDRPMTASRGVNNDRPVTASRGVNNDRPMTASRGVNNDRPVTASLPSSLDDDIVSSSRRRLRFLISHRLPLIAASLRPMPCRCAFGWTGGGIASSVIATSSPRVMSTRYGSVKP